MARSLPLGLLLVLLFPFPSFGSGSWLEPDQPVAGEAVTLYYDPSGGPLAGAPKVFVHRGINSWTAVAAPDQAMTRDSQSGVYELSYVLPEAAQSVEYAFNNGSGTWDNNNSADWRFSVTPMAPPAALPPPPPLPQAASRSGVMMQGFYWDVPAGNWYATLAARAAGLRNMASGQGIDRIWFPPPSKGDSGPWSMGYDPYDYYDLGQYNQKGTIRTRFGTQIELRNAIAAYRDQGIVVMADIVLNHRSGGAWEYNPVSGESYWTDFTGVASGKCAWNYDDFHPSSRELSDEGSFGGFPDVCHVGSTAAGDPRFDLVEWGNWLMDPVNAGFDGGWRFDFVIGFTPSMIRDFRAGTGNAFGILECWSSVDNIRAWMQVCAGISAFDFPGYYALRDVCNAAGGSGNIANLVDPRQVLAASDPEHAVTFVANHDTDEITANKLLAYAFILTYQGYPCLFWRDYVDRGLAGPGTPTGNGIDPLVWVRGALGGGAPEIEVLKGDHPDLLVYGTRNGTVDHPGYIVVMNDHYSQPLQAPVVTGNPALRGRRLECYAWYSYAAGQNSQPASLQCAPDGSVTVGAPARGYAVYGPADLARPEVRPAGAGMLEVEVHNTIEGRSYTLYASEDLASWTTEQAFTGSSTGKTLLSVSNSGRPSLFLRVGHN